MPSKAIEEMQESTREIIESSSKEKWVFEEKEFFKIKKTITPETRRIARIIKIVTCPFAAIIKKS